MSQNEQLRMTSFYKPMIAGNTDVLPDATAMMITMVIKRVKYIYFTIRQSLDLQINYIPIKPTI